MYIDCLTFLPDDIHYECRSGEHVRQPRSACTFIGSSSGRVCMEGTNVTQVSGWKGQVVTPRVAPPLRSPCTYGLPKNGFRRTGCSLIKGVLCAIGARTC
jgi:hypothetical protein